MLINITDTSNEESIRVDQPDLQNSRMPTRSGSSRDKISFKKVTQSIFDGVVKAYEAKVEEDEAFGDAFKKVRRDAEKIMDNDKAKIEELELKIRNLEEKHNAYIDDINQLKLEKSEQAHLIKSQNDGEEALQTRIKVIEHKSNTPKSHAKSSNTPISSSGVFA